MKNLNVLKIQVWRFNCKLNTIPKINSVKWFFTESQVLKLGIHGIITGLKALETQRKFCILGICCTKD